MKLNVDESGEYVVGRIFDAQFCLQIPIDHLESGDYIEFYRQGMRCRRVKSVHKGRKHNYVQFYPCRACPFKNQRINLKDIDKAWRPQPTLELWEGLGGENYKKNRVQVSRPWTVGRHPQGRREQRVLPKVQEAQAQAESFEVAGDPPRHLRKSRRK